jgi:AraC-like DNA-binding protein
MANLLRSYAEQIVGNRDTLTAAESALLGQHVVDMVSLILGADGDDARQAQLRGMRAAMLERIKRHILDHHIKADFTIGEVTARFKVSERYVQMLFEATGETFSDYVAEQRLQTARRQLTGPNGATRKLIDIAQSSGFGDLSYFHRRFRRRFGMTPAELRREAL